MHDVRVASVLLEHKWSNGMTTKRSTPSGVHGNSPILNCIKSKATELDWTIEAAAAAGHTPTQRIPPALDLRARWWTVNHQGDSGSCVGWAVADSVLRWHMVKSRKLTTKERLSVRFIWMAAKETDVYRSYPSSFIEEEGTSLKAGLDIARKYGVVLEDVLPFGSSKLFAGEAKTLLAMAAKRKISSYFSLGDRAADWRKWIAQHGPILARIEVDKTFANATKTTAKLEKYDAESADGGHAVAIVGYTLKHFIIRNSWGTEWGDGGFAYASVDYVKDAVTEAYGVVV